MKKNKIQEIISLSSLIMTDSEYIIFINYIQTEEFTSARLFLDNLETVLYDQLKESGDSSQIVIQYERCGQLENLVLDLIIGDIELNDKKRNPRRRICVT